MNTAELYVGRDILECPRATRNWRLYWSVPGSSSFNVDESTVTGRRIWFSTKADAVAYAEHKHGITPMRANWPVVG